MSEPKNIIIKNARVNNLKNVSLKIPRNEFVVISGVSGSGNHLLRLIQYLLRDKESISKALAHTQGNF